MRKENELKFNERSRLINAIAFFIVILLGLSSRNYSNMMPKWIGDYAGDTLWALMVFLGMGFLFKKWSALRVGLTALLFSFAIEASQLYHAPWIDGIRKTRLGALVLGFGFLWSDLACYTAGILIGMLFERLIIEKLRIR